MPLRGRPKGSKNKYVKLIPFNKYRSKAVKRMHHTLTSRINNMIYPYKQWCDSSLLSNPSISSGNPADTYYAFQFTLDMIPQVATFAALYDQYRITEIQLIVRASAVVTIDEFEGQGLPVGPHQFIYCIDHDDANVPTSYNQIREYGNAKEMNMVTGKDVKIKFQPYVSTLVYNGITPAYRPVPAPFLDLSVTNVPHYGVKMALKGSNVSGLLSCNVSARYCIEFKNTR